VVLKAVKEVNPPENVSYIAILLLSASGNLLGSLASRNRNKTTLNIRCGKGMG